MLQEQGYAHEYEALLACFEGQKASTDSFKDLLGEIVKDEAAEQYAPYGGGHLGQGAAWGKDLSSNIACIVEVVGPEQDAREYNELHVQDDF